MQVIKNVIVTSDLLVIGKSAFIRNEITCITLREPLSLYEALWPNLVAFGVLILYLGLGLIPIIYLTNKKVNYYAVNVKYKEQSKTIYISKEEADLIKSNCM